MNRNLLKYLAVPVCAISAAGGALVTTAFAQNGGRVAQAPTNPEVALSAPQMSGANEFPTAADPDGSGTAVVKINPVTYEVCVSLNTQNIAAPTGFHIHRGVAGANGPIVIDFDGTGGQPSVQKCIIALPVAAEVASNPSGFYVNVHNNEYQAGAIRAQLQVRGGEIRLLDAPKRVYDSRSAGGVLLAGSTRTIPLNPAGGIPLGARGALVTITVTGTTGGGYITAYSAALTGGVPDTSTINWSAANQDVATTTIVAVDGQGRIAVTAGPGGGTHVLVDVIGFMI